MRHLLIALLLAPLTGLPTAAPPVVCWTFDEARDTDAVQQARQRLDSLQGAIEFVPGVRGSGLKFDGFTSRLVRAAKDLPQFGPALTVEAWIAPQEYSWAWTGIVDHDQNARAGFFLGLNHLGQVGFYAAVDGQWLGCDSKESLALSQSAAAAAGVALDKGVSVQEVFYLKQTGDPRVVGDGDIWETYPRYSPIRKFPPPETQPSGAFHHFSEALLTPTPRANTL